MTEHLYPHEYLRTGIGSLPFRDVRRAIDVVLQFFPKVPFWPQLPRRSPLEDMFVPFLYDFPFFRLVGERLVVSKEEAGLEPFLEDVEEQRLERFSIPYELVPGFYELLARIEEIKDEVLYVKCQITGPFTCGLALKVEREPIIYDPDVFYVVQKGIKMRARWMVEEIRKACPSKPVILFLDEPYLCALDLFFGPESKGWVKQLYQDLFDGLPAIKGMHICGNTDWTLIMDLPIQILNFDAFNFFDSLFCFEDAIRSFYGKGSMISPGIVPSEAVVNETSLEALLSLRERFTATLSRLGIKLDRVLITPSCGLGSLHEREVERALGLLVQLSM